MIVKMKFLSISGPKNDIDRVCEVYLSKYEMQLENAAAELICKEFIWSGISWAKYQVTPDSTDEIFILLKNRTEINVTVKWQVGLKGVSKNLEKSI